MATKTPKEVSDAIKKLDAVDQGMFATKFDINMLSKVHLN